LVEELGKTSTTIEKKFLSGI